jgi:mitochondrial-processing peptidase subunit beta
VPRPQGYGKILASIPETKVTTLPNGLRVATESQPWAQTATVGVWIDAGSRYESRETNGTAHFLEHLAFKGTQRRSVKQLEVEVENMGGHLNAYTSREHTCYYAKVTKEHVGGAVDILADILQHSRLDEAAIERERSVILREMQEVNGDPAELVFDHLHATAFQKSSLGRTILGPTENVKRISKADIAAYIRAHYTAPRMVLVGAGAISHEQLVDLATKQFGSLPREGANPKQLLAEAPAHFVGSEVRMRDPDSKLLHFALAYKGASWTDPDAVPLMLMQTMLGSWNRQSVAGKNASSNLALKAASTGIAESFMAFNTNYNDTGLFGVYATCKPDQANDLGWLVVNETTRLCYEVSEDALQRAKNQLKAALLHTATDNTTSTAEDIGRQLLVYGRRIPKEEMFARVDAVTTETVKQVAARFLYDGEVAISALGETYFLPEYMYFRSRTFWLRY